MSEYERHRRNQIVAQRTARKAAEDFHADRQYGPVLWRMVQTVLDDALNTRTYLGHIDKAAQTAMAIEALKELKLRGTQLKLFEDSAS